MDVSPAPPAERRNTGVSSGAVGWGVFVVALIISALLARTAGMQDVPVPIGVLIGGYGLLGVGSLLI